MLNVATFLSRSEIHGVGVFAASEIPAGVVIWEFTPDIDLRIPEADFERFPEPYRSQIRPLCYLERDGVLVLCGDNARFMNHSFDPNCTDREGPVTMTLRGISAGEELTCDYRTFDLVSARDGLESWRATSGRTDPPAELVRGVP